MNLTGRPVTPKGNTKPSQPSKAIRKRWERIRALGCWVCSSPPHIHHCMTSAGGRKDHAKVIPLCELHHTGKEGIHTLGRRKFAELHGTEEEIIYNIKKLLGEIIL